MFLIILIGRRLKYLRLDKPQNFHYLRAEHCGASHILLPFAFNLSPFTF